MKSKLERESSQLRVRVARWREIFFSQKYRFDLGQSFLVIVNFTLLIITASDKLMIFFGIPRLRELMIVIIPISLNSSSVAPSIAGINIKNENLATSFLSAPIIIPVLIVVPLRETPGKTDNT